jgi:hypothetical protein
MSKRGFHVKNDRSRQLLETVGRSFLQGYRLAAEARVPADAEPPLEQIERQFRGFAYEGAAMACAVRDALPGSSGRNVERFLAGRGDAHVYMAYVGVGWAMARVPRFTWKKLHAPDPLLRWLVLDGYGFHQAYFQTRKYVMEHHNAPVGWPVEGPAWYAARVVDQGIGRATWFVGGTDPREVARLLDRFPPERRADLYSGAALAATYAGGVDADELRWFADHAGAYRDVVAQGSAFAAGARVRAGLVTPHTELATGVLCGMSAEEAWEVTEKALPVGPSTGDEPAYETWRREIAVRLAAARG